MQKWERSWKKDIQLWMLPREGSRVYDEDGEFLGESPPRYYLVKYRIKAIDAWGAFHFHSEKDEVRYKWIMDQRKWRKARRLKKEKKERKDAKKAASQVQSEPSPGPDSGSCQESQKGRGEKDC